MILAIDNTMCPTYNTRFIDDGCSFYLIDTNTLEMKVKKFDKSEDIDNITGILDKHFIVYTPLSSLLSGCVYVRENCIYYNNVKYKLWWRKGVFRIRNLFKFTIDEQDRYSFNDIQLHYGIKVGDFYKISVLLILSDRKLFARRSTVRINLIIDKEKLSGIEDIKALDDITIMKLEIYKSVPKDLTAKLRLIGE